MTTPHPDLPHRTTPASFTAEGARQGKTFHRLWFFPVGVEEITKTTPMRISNSHLFRAFYSKGVGHHDLYQAETQRQAEE